MESATRAVRPERRPTTSLQCDRFGAPQPRPKAHELICHHIVHVSASVLVHLGRCSWFQRVEIHQQCSYRLRNYIIEYCRATCEPETAAGNPDLKRVAPFSGTERGRILSHFVVCIRLLRSVPTRPAFYSSSLATTGFNSGHDLAVDRRRGGILAGSCPVPGAANRPAATQQ